MGCSLLGVSPSRISTGGGGGGDSITIIKKPGKVGNPDPANYRVSKFEYLGGHLITEIVYPDCVNFEGKKVLVFKKGVTLEKLLKRNNGFIDPHFSDDTGVIHPVARFEPSEAGWHMARRAVIG